jgi:hypothetical protein
LAELPEEDPARHIDVIAALAAELPSPTTELVPWLGQRNRDLVTQARRRLRPPADRQVSCSLSQLRWGSSKVEQVWRLASDRGIALLRTTVSAGERQLVLDATANLMKESEIAGSFAVLDVNPFKGKDGDELVAVELLVMPRRGRA